MANVSTSVAVWTVGFSSRGTIDLIIVGEPQTNEWTTSTATTTLSLGLVQATELRDKLTVLIAASKPAPPPDAATSGNR